MIKLTDAIAGYTLAAEARGLSKHTLADYHNTFRKLLAWLDDDPDLDRLTHIQIERFLVDQDVSNKTRLNYHTGLSALYTWAVDEGLAADHLLQRVPRPEPKKPAIKPYTETDIKAMLDSLDSSRPYSRPGKRTSSHTLPHQERNRAIILLLVDTGLRASELSAARIHHCDLRNRRILVIAGKGDKERYVPFSARTGQALWRYLATRRDESAGAPLFVTGEGRTISRLRLLRMIETIAARAGVAKPHNVHRFRHTFAINYLRNGGDPYTLQIILGHSTMEMVKTYLSLARADIERIHQQASPVDNWRL